MRITVPGQASVCSGFHFTAGRWSSPCFLQCPPGSSWGCHPCVGLKHQTSSLSSEITALKAKWHRTTMLFHAADKNDSMALANATWSDSFLSKHKIWETRDGGPSWMCQNIFYLFWDGICRCQCNWQDWWYNTTWKDPASFWSCPFIPAGTDSSSGCSG